MEEKQTKAAAQAAGHEAGGIKWFGDNGSPIDPSRMTLEKATHPADDPDGQLWPAAVDGLELHPDERIAEEMFERTPYYTFTECSEEVQKALQEWLELNNIQMDDPETFWFQDGFVDCVWDDYLREQRRMERWEEREMLRSLSEEDYEQLF